MASVAIILFINSRELVPSTQPDFNDTDLIYKNWLDGTFNSGEFWNSFWMKGTFNNGKFYNSEWYSGTWNNGILGSSNIPYDQTKMATSAPIFPLSVQFTEWNNGIVENALIGGDGSINWRNGKFLNGEMTRNSLSPSTNTTWHKGDFLGGKITGYVLWKDGNFYKGKFASILGWDAHRAPDVDITSDWGWEKGIFYGGEFGNGIAGTNSVWQDGEFRGGIFMGRLWNRGIFSNGEFLGSIDNSIYNSQISAQSDIDLVNKFSGANSEYYGLWRNGIVTDTPQSFSTQSIQPEIKKKSEIRRESRATFKNMLWLEGTFNHDNSLMQSSVWLNGDFYNGTFDSGLFNPFVDRTFDNGIYSYSTSSVWHNGRFNSTVGTGSFYFSEWKKGTFEKGYMSGAIWKDGVWNYGTAENIYWENGIWRNGNWNGAPFKNTDLNLRGLAYEMNSGRSKEIILHISRNLATQSIYMMNVFSASIGTEILRDITIPTQNGSTSSVAWFQGETYIPTSTSATVGGPNLNCSEWSDGLTFSDGLNVITNSHVYTIDGDPEPPRPPRVPGYNWTSNNSLNVPESHKLYARDTSNDTEIFTINSTTYEIRIQLTVEGKQEILVQFGLGNSTIEYSLESRSEIVGGNTNYWAKQYNITLVYNTPDILTSVDKKFYIKKIGVGILRILAASIREYVTEYHPTHNNTLYNAISSNRVGLPNDPDLDIEGLSDTAARVSINFGNGLFRSGIWENGVWNNGYRSNSLIGEEDYYRFSNIVGFNGLRPFGGKNSYQVSGNNWTYTMKGLDSVTGLNVGDIISIGNVVAIDINERRRLIKDYFKITNVDITTNTISVNLLTNFPLRRIEIDSDQHLIYVTKNIWLSGAFLNGYFKGVWNNGLFKGSPYTTIMEKSHWIDGTFDGGHFISREVIDTLINRTYKDGLIQNFNFTDNNVAAVGSKKYISWIDVNFDSHSRTQLNLDSTLYKEEKKIYLGDFPTPNELFLLTPELSYSYVEYAENHLGLITYDVLQSVSSFREKNSSISRQYNLGTKFTKFENFIPDDGRFLDDFSNNLPGGITLEKMFSNGWTFSDFGPSILGSGATSANILPPLVPSPVVVTEETFPGSYIYIDSNVDNSTAGKLRLKNSTLFKNADIQNTKDDGNTLPEVLKSKFSGLILENENLNNFRNRYYISQVDVATYSEIKANYIDPPTPGIDLLTQSSSFIIELINGINELNNPNPIKTNYFFNRRDLKLKIQSSSWGLYQTYTNAPIPNPENSFEITFNNISFWEVDMIPFFKYYEPSEIDDRVKTPFFATAPFIDYTNANFDFIGNVNILLDSSSILSQNVGGVVQSSSGFGGTFRLISTGIAEAQDPRNSGSFL